MKTLADILVEINEEQEKYFQDYPKCAKMIKEEAERLLGEVEVFVFGSILRKDEPKRDADILVISSKLNTTGRKIMARRKILRRIGLSLPFEIHLITLEEYKNWYQFFIKEKKEIK